MKKGRPLFRFGVLTALLLLVMLLASSGYGQTGQSSARNGGNRATAGETNAETTKLLVYYFHTTSRCYSCVKIERLTREAIDESFMSDVREGRLEVRSINVQKSANKHYIEDYGLYSKSVVLSKIIGGHEKRWKNLTRVWELLRSEKDFKNYIRKEVTEYLKDSKS